MSSMMIMQLWPAQQLLDSCDDEEMQEYLAAKIDDAEYANICSDVFISFYINSYVIVAQENGIEFTLH